MWRTGRVRSGQRRGAHSGGQMAANAPRLAMSSTVAATSSIYHHSCVVLAKSSRTKSSALAEPTIRLAGRPLYRP